MLAILLLTQTVWVAVAAAELSTSVELGLMVILQLIELFRQSPTADTVKLKVPV